MRETRGSSDQIIGCAGLRVAVRRVRREGPVRGTILFVNGAITTLMALRWAERGLTDFDLVLFDFPLVGASEALNPGLGRLCRDQEIAVVAGLIDRYAPDYLISLSWGGMSALSALTGRPASVRRAIVSSFAFRITEPLRRLCAALVALGEVGRLCEAARLAVDELGQQLPERMKGAYQRYFETLNPAQVAYLADHMRDLPDLDATALFARLRAIEIPVLFANGAGDRFTPPSAAREFAHHVPDARFTQFAGAGHFLALESKETCERVCETVRGFFPALVPA